MTTYVVRFAETGRETQTGKLRRDLARVIRERVPGAAIEVATARLFVDAADDQTATLAALPGVLSVSPAERLSRADIEAAIVALARARLEAGESFAVRVRRVGERSNSERTPELARALGDAVHLATGARVDLTNPDVTLGVERHGDDLFLFADTIAGIDRTGPPSPRADGEPRFVADQMLGRLAARLRLLGYDTLTVHDLADSEVTRLAAADGRILLTRDGPLSRTQAVPVHFVAATSPRAQLAEVLAAFSLTPDPERFFTRCTLCNTPIEAVAEAAVHDELPPGVRDRGLTFFRCPSCAQVYWHGSHVERILAEFG